MLIFKTDSEGISAEDQAEQLTKLAKAAKNIESTLTISAKNRTKALAEAKSEIIHLLEKQSPNSTARKSFSKTLDALDQLLDKTETESKAVQEIVGQVAKKEKIADVISQRFEQLNSQITDTYETVGIGLAAQGLVHELHPLLEEIAARAKKIKVTLERQAASGLAVSPDLDTIRTIANLISRKMSFLDPMLRTFRETREDIELYQFIKDFFSLRNDRFEKLGIKTFVETNTQGAMLLAINRGRLTQILDNLTRNSEYWLRDYGLKNPEQKLEIHAKIESPKLIFYDTGPGVRPALEKVIFDIFVTDKPKGQGHGLGLFIVSQILNADGCSINLGTNRNKGGRRFEFVVDFSGVIQ